MVTPQTPGLIFFVKGITSTLAHLEECPVSPLHHSNQQMHQVPFIPPLVKHG